MKEDEEAALPIERPADAKEPENRVDSGFSNDGDAARFGEENPEERAPSETSSIFSETIGRGGNEQ